MLAPPQIVVGEVDSDKMSASPQAVVSAGLRHDITLSTNAFGSTGLRHDVSLSTDKSGSSGLRHDDEPGPSESSSSLSLQLIQLNTKTSIPTVMLKGIWKKASRLVASRDSIVAAPGYPSDARMVASASGTRPHLVTKGKDQMYHCDNDCANYKSLKICSHTVAVAEVNGELKQFIEVFTNKRRRPNLTKLALHGMPAGRG